MNRLSIARLDAHGSPGALVAAYRAEIWPESGTDARLRTHLEQEYGGSVTVISPLDAAVYGIDWTDGRRWIARVSPPSRSADAARADVDLLRFLERSRFPAERCAHENAIATMEGRSVIVTTRVEGAAGRNARGRRLFRAMGSLLGRLQTLTPDGVTLRSPAGSWHHAAFEGGGRRHDIDILSRLLADAQDIAPADDRALYTPLRERLAELDDCGDLPQAIVHPDYSLANTILPPTGQPVLIDWTNAGIGPRILSLGTLLGCAAGDLNLVDDVVDGYRTHVQLNTDEIARLPDAIRGFGLIVDCWTAVFRPKAVARVVKACIAKWYVASMIAARAQERLGG
jgi:Ser/Thr protein kinase RdoA (MazF antagonist)